MHEFDCIIYLTVYSALMDPFCSQGGMKRSVILKANVYYIQKSEKLKSYLLVSDAKVPITSVCCIYLV